MSTLDSSATATGGRPFGVEGAIQSDLNLPAGNVAAATKGKKGKAVQRPD